MERRRRLRRKKYPRIMPKNFQIYNFKRIFLKANADSPDFPDPAAEMDKIDFKSYVDSTFKYSENLDVLRNAFPDYRWDIPVRKKISKKDARFRRRVNKGKNLVIYSFEVPIKRQKVWAKGRQYLHGRIQLTVDKDLIGQKAKIRIYSPRKRKKS